VSDLSSTYEVRVHGEASVPVLEALCADVEMAADTLLHAVVEDKTAIRALLARTGNVGLEIVHVHRLP
jgi:hypothetical protein